MKEVRKQRTRKNDDDEKTPPPPLKAKTYETELQDY